MRPNLSRNYRCAALAAVLVGLFAGALVAQTPDAHIGVWKLNVAKSKYDPGPAPKSGVAKWEAVATGTKVTVDDVEADGAATHWEFTANYDGKDQPITGTSPLATASPEPASMQELSRGLQERGESHCDHRHRWLP